jgi:hypothetical protein
LSPCLAKWTVKRIDISHLHRLTGESEEVEDSLDVTLIMVVAVEAAAVVEADAVVIDVKFLIE